MLRRSLLFLNFIFSLSNLGGETRSSRRRSPSDVQRCQLSFLLPFTTLHWLLLCHLFRPPYPQLLVPTVRRERILSPHILLCPHCLCRHSILPLESPLPSSICPQSLTTFAHPHPSLDLASPDTAPTSDAGSIDLTPFPFPGTGTDAAEDPFVHPPSNFRSPASSVSISAIPNDEISDMAAVCAICKEDLLHGSSARRLPCSQLYHSDCIVPWLSICNSCPLCRSPIPGSLTRRHRTPRFRVRMLEPEDEYTYLEVSRHHIREAPVVSGVGEISLTQIGLEERESVGPANSRETVSSEWPVGISITDEVEADGVMSDIWEDAFS